jgi:hypothetical protein
MNNCRKVELHPKEEEIVTNEYQEKVIKMNDTPENNENKSDMNESQNNIEKIDLNLIKIVEDIVNRVLEKKFPNKRITSRVLDTPIISKFAFKPLISKVKSSKKSSKVEKIKISSKRNKTAPKSKTKRLKSNNWIYLSK